MKLMSEIGNCGSELGQNREVSRLFGRAAGGIVTLAVATSEKRALPVCGFCRRGGRWCFECGRVPRRSPERVRGELVSLQVVFQRRIRKLHRPVRLPLERLQIY